MSFSEFKLSCFKAVSVSYKFKGMHLPFDAAVRKLHQLTLPICNMNLDQVRSQLLPTDLETLLTASSADEPKLIAYSNRLNSVKVSLLCPGQTAHDSQ